MKVVFETTGFRELERALAEELPRATAKATLRRAAKKALELVAEKARALAPVDDGDLANSIKVKSVRARRRRGQVRFDRSSGVELAAGPTFLGYPYFQEFGTIKQRPQPFMRPAVDSEGRAAIDLVGQQLATEINRSKARIARKAARAKAKG